MLLPLHSNQSAIVLIQRGTCQFGKKARMAAQAGASTVIFINDQPGISHAPGPDAHNLDICAVMITQREGHLLKQSIKARQGDVEPYAR